MIHPLSLDGTWERKGRNPAVGAFILVLAVGTCYFLVQSIILNGYVLVDTVFGSTFLPGSEEGASALRSFYGRFQVVILLVLPLTQFFIILLIPLLVSRRWHTRNVFRYFRFDRFPVAGVVASVAGVLLLLPSVEAIGELMYSLFPGLEKLARLTEPLVQARSTPLLLLTVFSIAVTPAVCEETLFRGYFQRTLERRLAMPWHFLLSGLLFALFHQEVLSLPSLFLVGIYLGFVYNRLRSIFPGAFSHFSYNGVIIWMTNAPPRRSEVFGAGGTFTPAATLVSALLFVALVSGLTFFTRRRGVNSITKM